MTYNQIYKLKKQAAFTWLKNIGAWTSKHKKPILWTTGATAGGAGFTYGGIKGVQALSDYVGDEAYTKAKQGATQALSQYGIPIGTGLAGAGITYGIADLLGVSNTGLKLLLAIAGGVGAGYLGQKYKADIAGLFKNTDKE